MQFACPILINKRFYLKETALIKQVNRRQSDFKPKWLVCVSDVIAGGGVWLSQHCEVMLCHGESCCFQVTGTGQWNMPK